MSDHLLLVALGPVQDFIAQARRTRDLWHGSQLISELSRAVARSLAEHGARLLIPAMDSGGIGLAACWTPIRPDTGTPPEAVANKIWALVPADHSPEQLARSAREAAKDSLREHAKRVWEKLGSLLPRDVQPVWNEQVEDTLEFTAGWLPLDTRPFGELRAELDDAISARKRLRDFRPWIQQRGAVRKSSLDGGRESVLPDRRKPERKLLQQKFGLAESEELDAIGLIKRAGADPEQFIPLINVALAPWIAWAARHRPAELEACQKACRALGVQRIESPMLADDFRFEASILLPDRWPSLADEHGYNEPKHQQRWAEAKAAVERLRDIARAPKAGPYVACLVGDGDRMGDAINRIQTPEDLRRFSSALSVFASSARTIVIEHRGSLVYAGGDDVLAFLPVTTALACADALRQRFHEIVSSTCRELGLVDDEHPVPSISVGVGIGHYMESMGELLALGREAEDLAKGVNLAAPERRNALAIIVDKRSGGRRVWRTRWGSEPLARLARDQANATRLSVTKIYEIATTLERLPRGSTEYDTAFSTMLERELARSLARNEGEPLSLIDVGLVLPDGGYPEQRQAVYDWIDRLLIARELDRADIEPRARQEWP